MKYIRYAAIYMRNGNFYIRPCSSTTQGLLIEAEPVTEAEDNVTDEALGKNILDTLVFSKENMPNPTDWSQVGKPLFAAAKVRTWKAFMSGAELISLENIKGTIKLTPYVNQGATGPNRGFTPNADKTFVLSAKISAAELGKAVKEMFKLC